MTDRVSRFSEGLLSASEYQQWYSDRVFSSWGDAKPHSNEIEYVKELALPYLSQLSESKFLISNFWRLSEEHAYWFTDLQDESISVEALEVFMKLLIRLQEERPERCLSSSFSKGHLRMKLENDITSTLDPEECAAFKNHFTMLINLEEAGYYKTFLVANLHVLFTLENLDIIVRVLEVCYSTRTTNTVDFFNLVSAWDTVKDMPADWALEYVRSGRIGL